MKVIRKILGIIIIIAGIIGSLYLSACVLFAGGIKDIVQGVAANDATGITIGALKVWGDWIGMIPSIITYFLGMVIYGGND